MTEAPSGVFVLKVDIVAAGTQLRIGSSPLDFWPVEKLTVGDEIYDPIEERHVEITEMFCVTLDNETVRDRGFSPKMLASPTGGQPLIYGVKVPVLLARAGHAPPIRGEYTLSEGTVFFSLAFERRTVVEMHSAYCEFIRPHNYAFESAPGRNSNTLRDDLLPLLR